MRTHPLMAAVAVIALTIVASSPRITNVAIGPPGQGSSPQVLTVSGEGFVTGLSLTVTTPNGGTQYFKGADVQSPRESSFQVSMILATAGTYTLVVTNPDGGMSAPFALRVPAAAEKPVIDAVTPSKASVLPEAQVLRVEGKRFMPGLAVSVTDPTGTVTNASGNDVMEVTPTGFRVSVVLALEGQYTLIVTNPDGAVSNAVTVTAVKGR
jgi:hypothetical protein